VTIRAGVLPLSLPFPRITSLKLAFKLEAVPPVAAEVLLLVEGEGGMNPVVSVVPEDRAGRGTGQTPVIRFFDDQASVRLKAPERFAERTFKAWMQPDGSTISDREITVRLEGEATRYVPLYE
jgi:hypothetical protein